MIEITAAVTAMLHIDGVGSASDAIIEAVKHMQQRIGTPKMQWKVVSVRAEEGRRWRVDMVESFR